MNKDDLRELLAQPYQFNNWKKVVDFVFPNVSYLQTPVTIPIEANLVESFRQVGSVRMNDGKNLALFEVHVKSNVNIARNRVALRNLVAGYIDQDRNHGILAIYEKGTDEYRFTYTAKETDYDEETGDFVQRETATKRFTYILGANETCRTARDRFWELSQHKEDATIQDVENAFSVEKLSKEFFAKYKSQYSAFVDYLTTSNFKISAFNANEKAIRDFVKKMLGRIVFLQFVQKKRWLGASDTHYQDGDKQFMNHFWRCSERNEAFYSVHLTKLFFDTLNKNHRTNDSFEMPDSTIVCVPHLGGGLFEKDREDPELLTFPPALFENLFSFFSEYNFTIDENDSHENEVGIDPEMLGQIFENLLEDNKDKGAFYTPKPIVKYMCQESLIQYLLTAFEKEGVVTNETENQELEEKLGVLVKKCEAHEVIEYDRILTNALYDVKICDPAIGSGAFPMGILNEMVILINVLHNASPDVVEDIWEMDNWQPATVKKHIIQNSIYGVDIEKGAVDIARLRFWLSLIIDEEKPCNLPSLDYKIVVGNSLISKFEDEIIDIDWELKEEATQGNLFGDENEKTRQKLLKDISKKQIEFYAAENHQKEKLKLEIRNLKIDLLINQLKLQINKTGLEKVQELAKAKTQKNQTDQYLKTQGWKQSIIKLESLKKYPNQPFNHFDWKLDFPEVLNPEIAGKNLGFDMVIGNPPYGVRMDNNIRNYLSVKFPLVPDFEIYLYFISHSLQILKKLGCLYFIQPNTFLAIQYGKNFRQHLLNNIIEIVDLSGFPVFEFANVRTCILSLKLGLSTSDNVKLKSISNNLEVKTIRLTNREYLSANIGNWLTLFSINETFEEIISKLKSNPKLSSYCNVIRGYIAYRRSDLIKLYGEEEGNQIINEKQWHSSLKLNDDYLPEIMGKDLSKYHFRRRELYIKYGKHLASYVNMKFYQNPHIAVREIAEKSLICSWIYELIISSSSTHLIITKDSCTIDLKVILSILNSKLLGWYHYNTSSKAKKGMFPKVLVEDINNFPISIKIVNYENRLVNLVNQILKSENSNQETTDLEREIDVLVFKSYELTYEEIIVVVPEFWMGREEYEKINILNQ